MSNKAKNNAPNNMPNKVGAEAFAGDNGIPPETFREWWDMNEGLDWPLGWDWQANMRGYAVARGVYSDQTEPAIRMNESALGPKERKSIFGQPLNDCINISLAIETISSMFDMDNDSLGHVFKKWIVKELCKASASQEGRLEKPKSEKIQGAFTQWEVCEVVPGTTDTVTNLRACDWKQAADRAYNSLAGQGKIARMYEVRYTPHKVTWHPENENFPAKIKVAGGDLKCC